MTDQLYDVCIVGGLGHVGLPLGISLAQEGKTVMLHDIDEEKVNLVSQGKMPFLEAGAEKILKKVVGKNLFLSMDKEAISQSHFVVIVIGTPVDRHLNPKFKIFKEFFNEILHLLKDNQHIILRSTLYPGTTEKVYEYLRSKGKRLKLSYCPERISQGEAIKELRTLPQIIASVDEVSYREASDLFSLLTKDILSLEPIEAELAKLFTNVWRYIQFATANQFYQLATHHGADFYKIYNTLTHKYPRAQNFPSAGFAAGPCLFKDTMQLAAFSNNNFFLGHAAMLINEGLPNFIVQILKDRYGLRNKKIGILGMAFKANSDDKRDSLSFKLQKILEIEATEVLCSDVYIQEEGFVSIKELVNDSDIIILATPHKEYSDVSIPEDKVLVDVWNFFGKGGLF